jgi:hypothetical protein
MTSAETSGGAGQTEASEASARLPGARSSRGAGVGGDRGSGEVGTPPDRRRSRRAVVSSRGGIAEQRRRFGGFKWGAAFFGWLVATGFAVLVTAIVSAAGVALAINSLSKAGARGNAATIGIAGGVALVVILAISYYAGGYVAGRLARFDGVRQGFGVWLLGVLVTLAFAAAGAIAGSQYNVLNRLNLPNVPVGSGTATTGGVAAVAAALVATLVAATVGGKLGELYHRKIDRVGMRTPPVDPATSTQVTDLGD